MSTSILTPNIGLTQPGINSSGWGPPTNTDWSIIDAIFGGTFAIPALKVTGTITAGAIVAGSFSGLNGAYFLQSSLFNQQNGVPQLNSAGKIPASLIAGNGVITVPYSTVPSFNAAQASVFNMTLTGNVTASTYINGLSGANIVAFRIMQDSVGGWTFAWPTNCRNFGAIASTPNSISVQLALLQTDGSLDAAAPISTYTT